MNSAPVPDDRFRSGSPDRFGFAWSEYSKILPESRAQLERWLGSTGLASFQGKRVLDVGCGMGRNAYWMARAGAVEVVAVDVDHRTLEAARRNLAGLENVRVRQLSIYDLDPEVVGLADRVTCIGVLHHLADPGEALRRMWSCVKPGGDMLLWCYGMKGNRWLLPLLWPIRAVGSRLPINATHVIARVVASASWPVVRAWPWRTEYFRNLRTLSYRTFESIVFDQFLPKIAHYWTREDLEVLLGPLQGTARVELVQGNSWHVQVEKHS